MGRSDWSGFGLRAGGCGLRGLDDEEVGGDYILEPFHARREVGMALFEIPGDDEQVRVDGLDVVGGGEARGALDAAGDDGDGLDVEFLNEGVELGLLGREGVGIVALDELMGLGEHLGEDGEDAEDMDRLGMGARGEIERGAEGVARGVGIIDYDGQCAERDRVAAWICKEQERAGRLADENAGDFSQEVAALAVALHGAGDEEADAGVADGINDGRGWEVRLAPMDVWGEAEVGEGLSKALLVLRRLRPGVDDIKGEIEERGDGPCLHEHRDEAR